MVEKLDPDSPNTTTGQVCSHSKLSIFWCATTTLCEMLHLLCTALLFGQVRVGDVVVQIEGIDVVGRPLSQVREMLKGPPGTYVQVVFDRQGAGQVTSTLLRVAGAEHGTMTLPASNSNLSGERKSGRVEPDNRVPLHRLITYDWQNKAQRSQVCDGK